MAAAFHIHVQSQRLGEELAMALFLLNLTSMTFQKLHHELFFFFFFNDPDSSNFKSHLGNNFCKLKSVDGL